MIKPFGYSYLLDMYGCPEWACDSLETSYRFLESLVDRLGMNKMSAPTVIHGPRKDGIEMYPDKAGISGWIPLIESGISIHTLSPKGFITLDVYSCKHFPKDIVWLFAKDTYCFTDFEESFLERGKKYYGE